MKDLLTNFLMIFSSVVVGGAILVPIRWFIEQKIYEWTQAASTQEQYDLLASDYEHEHDEDCEH